MRLKNQRPSRNIVTNFYERESRDVVRNLPAQGKSDRLTTRGSGKADREPPRPRPKPTGRGR